MQPPRAVFVTTLPGHYLSAVYRCCQKSQNTIIGPGDTVKLPSDDVNIFHHEAELIPVFGRDGKDIKQNDAMGYVFGYMDGARRVCLARAEAVDQKKYHNASNIPLEVIRHIRSNRPLHSDQR